MKMSIQVVLILALIGLTAGIFGGMVGLGGGVIMIPAMIYLLSMTQLQAQGTSLAVMLPPIGIFAAYNYYKAGHIDWRYALIIAAAFTIGGYFGSKIALNIPANVLRKVFALSIIAIALNMFFKK
jgi:uncharacterized protein